MEDRADASGRDRLTRRGRLARWILGAIARGVREPVIPVLALAGFFDLISGDPVVHGTLLFTVALALGVDAVRKHRVERVWASGDLDHAPALLGASWARRAGARVRLSPMMLIAGLLYVVVVGAFARYSWPASIAVFVPAAAGVAIAWRGPARRMGEPVPLARSGALVWAGAFVTLGLWELMNLFLQPSLTRGSQAHPTISVLMNPALASHAGRSIFLAVWLAVGLLLMER